jgi:hypothetical protein
MSERVMENMKYNWNKAAASGSVFSSDPLPPKVVPKVVEQKKKYFPSLYPGLEDAYGYN